MVDFKFISHKKYGIVSENNSKKKNHSCLRFKQIIRKSDFRIKTWKYEDGDSNGVLNTMDTSFYECRLIEINRTVYCDYKRDTKSSPLEQK